MFYPADVLRKGGRFYLCWVADTWPLCFEKLTHRNQRIWSIDICQTCDHLRELMNSESGRPTQRFSLRLSSQLMRGLVRIYQRQVQLLIREILTVQTMIRSARSRSEPTKGAGVPRRRPIRERSRLVIEELPPDEENLERIQERANNIVARVEDITLREPTLPEVRLREDGFGELNQDPVEMMLAHEASMMQQSALDVVLDFSTDKSHEKSRLAPHDAAQMERISEHDISVFRKSAVEAPTLTDFEKEIPEISEAPLTKLPAPEPQTQVIEQPLQEAQNQEPPRDQPAIEQARQNELEEIVLEDLQYEPPQKRRRVKKLIVDNTTKISSDEFSVRVANKDVEQRCESTAADVIDAKRINAATLLSRQRPTARLGHALTSMFARGYFEDEIEEAFVPRAIIQNETVQEPDVQEQVLQDISNRDVSVRNVRESEVAPYAQEIADLPTQKVLTLSQEKRASVLEKAAKRRRSLRSSALTEQETDVNKENIPGVENIPVEEHVHDVNKENIPGAENIPVEEHIHVLPTEEAASAVAPAIVLPTDEIASSSAVQQLSSMLEEAGLVDARDKPPGAEPATLHTSPGRRPRATGSEGSETPLGSLDRTKVSLGDSDNTTDSKRFIDDEWGVRGTMLKILLCVAQRAPRITVEQLVARGPVLAGLRRRIMARCFTSILRLRTHGFINIIKDPETSAIQHIELGPRMRKYD